MVVELEAALGEETVVGPRGEIRFESVVEGIAGIAMGA
jgi:hypothetical protein